MKTGYRITMYLRCGLRALGSLDEICREADSAHNPARQSPLDPVACAPLSLSGS